tara:strand:+ start:293 stop:883 length:591 start_codon:yes stop_codon:yes gene_type:complete
MSLGITKLQLTDVSAISIPTDAILILSLLIIFALLGYFFHNILDNQTNQFVDKVDDNLHLELVKEKLEDQLTLESAKENYTKSEKPNIKKQNFLTPSKFLGIGSLAIIAIGGSSLIKIQAIQNLYKGVNTRQIDIKIENQSAKSLLSMSQINSLHRAQTKIKKINYIDPLVSTKNSAKNNSFYRAEERQIEDFFSF